VSGSLKSIIKKHENEYKILAWKLKGRQHLAHLRADGRVKLKWIYTNKVWSEDKIKMADDGIILWTFVNMVTNLQIP